MVLLSSGKIAVAGVYDASHDQFVIVRLNADGSFDTSFDGDGLTITDLGDTARVFGLRLQPDGKLFAVGTLSSSGDHAAKSG